MARREKVFELEVLATAYGGENGQGEIQNMDRRWPDSLEKTAQAVADILLTELRRAWPKNLTEAEMMTRPRFLAFKIEVERKEITIYGK